MDVSVGLDPATGLAGGAVGAVLTTLVVGAILVALAPEFTADRMDAVLADPVNAFVYGLVVLVALALVVFVLVISFVGILVAVPLVILSVVVWAVGATIGFLAIADRLVGREDGWKKPLLVAAALNGALTVTGIGGILSFVVGAAGFGAVLEGRL